MKNFTTYTNKNKSQNLSKNIFMKLFIVNVFSISLAFTAFADAGVIYMPTSAPQVNTDTYNTESEYYDEEYDGPSESYSVGEISINNNYDAVFYGVQLEDDFYCSDNNQLVYNGWRKISIYSFVYYGMPIDGYTRDYIWCYFNNRGKAVKAQSGKFKKMKIDGNYYAFNEYGQMLEGFFNDEGEMYVDEGDNEPYDMLDSGNLYYADKTTGVLHTGWLEIPNNNSENYENHNTLWMYFSPSSFKAVHATGSGYKTETIDRKKYAFDDKGIMLRGFEAYDYDIEQGKSSGKIKYFGDDGALTSGFVKAVPSENMNEDDYEDEEEKTYYVNTSGQVYKNIIKKIGSSYYGFDKDGAMITGLSIWKGNDYVATIDSNETDGRDFILYGKYTAKDGSTRTYNKTNEVIHYFNENGKRTTSNAKIEFGDETYAYAGANSGAYNGFKDKKFYQNGLQMKPTEDKFGIFVMNAGTGGSGGTSGPGSSGTATLGNIKYNMSELAGNANVYVVNKSGAKVTSTSSQEDEDEKYWLVSSSGNLLNIYSIPVRKSGSNYQFKSEPEGGGNEKWINFGEKDRYGRTCVLAYTANGTSLANGAKAYYQTKPSSSTALNFILN